MDALQRGWAVQLGLTKGDYAHIKPRSCDVSAVLKDQDKPDDPVYVGCNPTVLAGVTRRVLRTTCDAGDDTTAVCRTPMLSPPRPLLALENWLAYAHVSQRPCPHRS